MGKLISWVALVFLLVVVPFGSWYYLKSGLDYRKNAIVELVVKDSFPAQLDSSLVLSGKTTVLTLGSDSIVQVVRAALLKQFEKTPGFQVVQKDSLTDRSLDMSIDQAYIPFIKKYEGKTFLLVDTAMQIRNAYTRNEQDIRKLIEHIAIVLPRQKETDIQFKK